MAGAAEERVVRPDAKGKRIRAIGQGEFQELLVGLGSPRLQARELNAKRGSHRVGTGAGFEFANRKKIGHVQSPQKPRMNTNERQ